MGELRASDTTLGQASTQLAQPHTVNASESRPALDLGCEPPLALEQSGEKAVEKPCALEWGAAVPSPKASEPVTAQRVPEGQEGGLKRPFEKLGGSEGAASQGGSRRAFKPAEGAARPGDAAVGEAFRPVEDEPVEGLNSGELPLEGLRIGSSNVRKRDASSTAWSLTTSLPHHKQRVQETEEGRARISSSFPEETDRLRLMQMQLSDRQSSHSQATSSSSSPRARAKPPRFAAAGGWPAATVGAGFSKASSPDTPEPPHKKGSGQATTAQQKQPTSNGSSLRRKQPDAARVGAGAEGQAAEAAAELEPGGPSPPPQAAENGSHGSRGPVPPVEGSEEAFLPGAELLDSAGRKILEKLVDSGQRDASGPPKELGPQLKLARLMGTRGKVAAAMEIAERLDLQHPGNADVLCLKGDCHAALSNKAQAFVCFSAALHADSRHVDALLSCASLYQSCMLLREAADVLRRAHEAASEREDIPARYAAALTDHGTKLKLDGQTEDAMALYEEALTICPDYSPAYYNLGVAYSEAREPERALELYAKAVSARPGHAEAHCNIGVIHKHAGRLDEAIASYERALAAAPGFDIVKSNLAVALTEKATRVKEDGDAERSIELYEQAIVIKPRHAEAVYNLAVVYGETRRLRRAALMYEFAALLRPDCAEALNNLGVVHRELGNMERALECYTAALNVRPNFPQALNNVAVVLTAQGKAQDAHNMLMAAIAASPSYAEAHNNLGVLQRDVGAVKDAIASYERCLELAPEARNAAQNRLLALNYVEAGESAGVCAEHERWGIEFQTGFEQLPPRECRGEDPDRRLVVAYLSPDLFTHSVSYFAEAPLTHHSAERVKLIAYNCSPTADAKTARLKRAALACGGDWVEAAVMNEHELATRVRADDVDILIELTGHTANNRLGVMALRPAHIQMTWIGYPNSTGLAAVDYRLTDLVCDPLETQQTFVEELVRLPGGCFLCYTPPEDAPAVSPPPSAELGFVTFGSFNALAKITPEVARLWARLLAAMPDSRLLLKSKPFACAQAQQHFLRQMEEEGISSERVDLLPLTAGNREHLATYAQMDISLDPWPYAGTTTTCESLYMGVPVVSLAGACHAHNVGASLLACVGLQDEWLARTPDEYVRLAAAAAADLQRLAETRAGLRDRMLGSPLCDGPAFVAGLEGVYRQLWRRKLATPGPENDDDTGNEWKAADPSALDGTREAAVLS